MLREGILKVEEPLGKRLAIDPVRRAVAQVAAHAGRLRRWLCRSGGGVGDRRSTPHRAAVIT